MVKNVRLQMKVHSFDPSDPTSTIDFLATFKHGCDTNRIHEKAAIRVLLFFTQNALALILNSCVFAATNITPALASAHSRDAKTLEDSSVISQGRQLSSRKVYKRSSDR